MKFHVSLLCLVLGISACGGNFSTSFPNAKIDNIPAEYKQMVNLNLSQTGQSLAITKSNLVNLRGSGFQSTYKVAYKFNSGVNASFKVIETRFKSEFSDCSPPQSDLYLKSKNVSRKLSVYDQVNVDVNTDYVLEIIITHSCKELDMTFDVIAWSGSPTDSPKIASICEGQKIPQMTFMRNYNFVTALSSIVGKEKFLSLDSYCGEFFPGSKIECRGFANLSSINVGSAIDRVQCRSERDGEIRSFDLDFDTMAKTASVVCKSNDVEIYSELFRNCNTLILNHRDL